MTHASKVLRTLLICSLAANIYLYGVSENRGALKVSALSEREFIVQYSDDREILRLLDKDQNGSIDMMFRRIKDESGKDIRDVLDYNLDGQDDMKVEFDDGSGYVWYEGHWEKFRFEDGHWYINIAGSQVELTESNSMMVKWHNYVYGN